jgi:3-methyl-2-oxobutanoate hydroxymethyltransferase
MSARRSPRRPTASPAAPAASNPNPVRPKVTCADLVTAKRAGKRIVMVTAYDHPFARLADAAGVDVLLVGDSLGMVVLGHDSTLPVTMADMLHHARAVARARPRALVVADLPFMSFQVSPSQAVRNAGRLLQQGGVEAVKLEGGTRVLPMIEAIVRADIPVMGHLGLTPQSVHRFGGYRVQGRGPAAGKLLLQEARALEAAGCFALVLEAIPAPLAARITAALAIPTIGIGAGADCDGQVLVLHDLLGVNADFAPRFVRRFGEIGRQTREAVAAFAAAVRSGAFPANEHTYR